MYLFLISYLIKSKVNYFITIYIYPVYMHIAYILYIYIEAYTFHNLRFKVDLEFTLVYSLITCIEQKRQNPFLSNFIELATVSERQAPPIHARPRLGLA